MLFMQLCCFFFYFEYRWFKPVSTWQLTFSSIVSVTIVFIPSTWQDLKLEQKTVFVVVNFLDGCTLRCSRTVVVIISCHLSVLVWCTLPEATTGRWKNRAMTHTSLAAWKHRSTRSLLGDFTSSHSTVLNTQRETGMCVWRKMNEMKESLKEHVARRCTTQQLWSLWLLLSSLQK